MNFTRQTIPIVTAAQEEPKQNSTAKQATVNIRVDANSSLLCDGEYIETQFQANKITKMNFPIGQHLLEFFDMDYPDIIIEQEVDWPEEGKSYLVIIKGLHDKIEAVQAAEAEKKRLEAENKAKAEAERKAKEEAEKKAKEEAERKVKEEAERKKGRDYVDMGLSVLWATCNIGASVPEQVGDYFAWGETKPKKSYTEDNYTPPKNLKNISGTSNDAAVVNWGGEWRMPTTNEFYELWEKCEKKIMVINNVKGLEFKASNNNTIFLPLADCYDASKRHSIFGDNDGLYWTGSGTGMKLVGSSFNFFVEFGELTCNEEEDSYLGLTIRPVLDKN